MARIRQEKDKRMNALDKQAESKKMSKVYSTEKIKQILDDLKRAQSPDLDPFWHGDPKYKDAGIVYQYTDEELAELEKCTMDAEYFIENYCTFKNDKGRTTVRLRDYQKKVLKLFGEEVWDPVTETVVPKNRYIAIMQSRQTGKCVTLDTTVGIYDDTDIAAKNAQKYSLLNFVGKKLKNLFKH